MDTNRNLADLQDDGLVKAFGQNGTMSKVQRYGWDKAGPVGTFMMISKKDLGIDLKYQRDLTGRGRVLQIARTFNWTCFGVLIVAMTKKEFFVLDGGHRLRGVLLRDDIDKVPCLVFELGATKEEAIAFWKINTQRRNVTAFDNHKAAVEAAIEIAVLADALVRKHGYEFTGGAPHGLQTCAVKTVYWMIERNKTIADDTFGLLAEVAQGTPIGNLELKALFYVMQMNPSVDFRTFPLDNMISAGVMGIRNKIKQSVMQGFTRTDYVACANALLLIINKGQRKAKVVLPEMAKRPISAEA